MPLPVGEQKRSRNGKDKKHETGNGTVYLVAGKEIKPVGIQLGISDNRNTEVIGGALQPGDKVVVGDNPANAGSKPSSVGMRLF